MVSKKIRLAIVTTHPIQYNAPLFRLLAERGRLLVKVFYTWSQAQDAVYDPGFGQWRSWDVPLLDGYDYCFVKNTAKKPGSHHFWGIKNPDLQRVIEDWGADAVLVYGWNFHSHLSLLYSLHKKRPVFFRGDSTLLDESTSVKFFAKQMFLRWLYRKVDAAFYTGVHNMAYFKKFGLPESRLVYAPHAIDNNRFSKISEPEWREVGEWRLRLGITDKEWVVLFAGKLEEKKNPHFMLKLAAKLKASHFRFLIIGNGHLENSLKKEAQDNRILFLDMQNQSKMPLVYRLANVMVLPSKGPGETWGLAANEAMACGLPVILSKKVGGATDLVENKDTGLIFEQDDCESVVTYISRLFDDSSNYKKIQENVKAHIRNFSLERTAQAMETGVFKMLTI